MRQLKFATWSLLLALLSFAAHTELAHAQSRSDKQRAKLAREFESKKRTALVEAGHRHLDWSGLPSRRVMSPLRRQFGFANPTASAALGRIAAAPYRSLRIRS